jgi:hypothetical protein
MCDKIMQNESDAIIARHVVRKCLILYNNWNIQLLVLESRVFPSKGLSQERFI